MFTLLFLLFFILAIFSNVSFSLAVNFICTKFVALVDIEVVNFSLLKFAHGFT